MCLKNKKDAKEIHDLMVKTFNADSGDYCKVYILSPQEIMSYYVNYSIKQKKKNCLNFIEYYNTVKIDQQEA